MDATMEGVLDEEGTVVVDFTQVKEMDFAPLPRGEYSVGIEKFEVRIGRDSGKPYIAWTLTVSDPEEFAGRKLWDNMSLSEAALFRVKGFLLAQGHTADDLEGEFAFNPAQYVGNEARVMVVQEKGNDDQTRNRISKWLPA